VTRRVGLAVALGLALIILPFVSNSYVQGLVTEAVILAMFAMSLDLLIGYTGLFSLGHGIFYALGAYTVVLLGNRLGVTPLLAAVAGILVATAGAIAIGAIATRVRGISFLMITLAFNEVIRSTAVSWRGVTGGSDGIGGMPAPMLGSLSLSGSSAKYYLTIVLFVLSYLALRRLVSSPLGLTFIGIRGNEARMRALGYPTARYKLAAFAIGGTFAGLAGATYAIFNGFVSPDLTHWSFSGDALIMVILGGTGTLIGPALGAVFFVFVKHFVSVYSDHWVFVIGAIFIACVMFFPKGMFGCLAARLAREPAK
jgi:branched-chain amino acid transport system permease protein